MPKRKAQVAVSYQTKFAIIKRQEKGESTYAISKSLNLHPRTVRNAIKSKENIKTAIEEGYSKRKRRRTSAFPVLDFALFYWIKTVRAANMNITGDLLKEKALQLSQGFNIQNFNASNGWLEKFKKRHEITRHTISGEGGNVDRNCIQKWEEAVLIPVLNEFQANDIFNVDETGLFYKRLSKYTLAERSESCQGTPQSKERLTVLVGANMTGLEKLPLFVIGKSQRPRSFRGATVPVKYVANSNSWMTKALFLNWLQEWNAVLTSNNRTIALFLDNCSAHVFDKEEIQLSNIKLVYFHPNTTSSSQPMDQGVIHSMKCHYNKIILHERLRAFDDGRSTYIPNILQGLETLASAWNNVTQSTIANCFRKANFSANQTIGEAIESNTVEEEVNQLMNQLNQESQFKINDEEEQIMVDKIPNVNEIVSMFSDLNAL